MYIYVCVRACVCVCVFGGVRGLNNITHIYIYIYITSRKTKIYREAPRTGKSYICIDLVLLHFNLKLTNHGEIEFSRPPLAIVMMLRSRN